MNCPSCAAPFSWEKQFAQVVICDHCHAAAVVSAGALKVAGKMAALTPAQGPFYVGATGTLSGLPIQVVGRVRYSYEQGFWDEWYVTNSGASGKPYWISEDEGELAMTHLKNVKVPEGYYDRATPGRRISLGDRSYQVRERGVAVCEGGEGQLPFMLLPGEKVPFLDLRGGGTSVATLEFEEEGARLYRGHRIEASSIKMDVPFTPGQSTPGPSTEHVQATGSTDAVNCYACGGPLTVDGGGSGVITCEYCQARNDLSHDKVTCPSCSSTFSIVAGSSAEMVVCAHCDHPIDVSGAEPALLRVLAASERPNIPFKMGQVCELRGVTYVLIGHIRTQTADAWGVYPCDEYMLYNQEQGYRWLVQENGHFSLSEEVHGSVPDMPNYRKASFSHDGRSYKVYEVGGPSKVRWVNGQLPYVARIGDSSDYIDAVSPPYMLSQETTDRESEYFLAEYIPRGEVAEAFGMEPDLLPLAFGLGANQPYSISPFRQSAMKVMGVFAGINLIAAMALAAIGAGSVAHTEILKPSQYVNAEVITNSFTLGGGSGVEGVKIRANLDNDWVYLDMAVLNESDEVVAEFSSQAEYYHGVEGGESWSEGDKDDSANFRVPGPGTYRILAKGEAGPRQHPITLTVRSGVQLARYNFGLFIFALLWAGLEFLLRGTFEGRRWGQEDDDDDDDGFDFD